MDFKYRWKNGAPPTRDQAAHSQHLLDESQFNSKEDHIMAQDARKHLGVPTRIPDDDRSVLPTAPNDLEEPSQI